MNNTLNVHIGEVKIAKRGEYLKAILGSCVGIGLIWKEKKRCGLAHCLLPESPKQSFDIGARFVDQAVRSLVALMKIPVDEAKYVDAVVAGGGNMTGVKKSSASRLIGENNFATAMREINQRGFRIIHSEGGGTQGRRISIDGSLLTFEVAKIPRLAPELTKNR